MNLELSISINWTIGHLKTQTASFQDFIKQVHVIQIILQTSVRRPNI